MQTPTIVKQTKDYILIKVPLPKRGTVLAHPQKSDKMTTAKKRLWNIIQGGYREGKTIRASSTDEALKMYERRQKSTSH